MVKLSKNFDSSEFLVSAEYPELIVNYKLKDYEQGRLSVLCRELLQPIRDKFGALRINSGFRTKELNAKIKGSMTSDHCRGLACDFVPVSASIDDVYKWIVSKDLPYRQVIKYPNNGFIHISVNLAPFAIKHQALVSIGGKYNKYSEVV